VIITRQRRKPFPWRRLILPIIAIGLVVFAFVWGPSRNVITSGPAAPLWNVIGSTFDKVAVPFHFAAQNQKLTDANKQIVTLNGKLSDLQGQMVVRDKQITDLNSQVAQLQSQAASTRASAAPAASAAPGSAAAAAGASPGAANDLTTGATPDMRRTAQDWANMEPDNLAKVLPKLPVTYVARILALMSPDTVGPILDALPPAYVATLTQENPGLKR